MLRRLAGRDDLPPPEVVVAPIRSVLQPQVRGLAEMAPSGSRWGRPTSWAACSAT
ncbi:hypothetical protein G7085_06255 [Tessaracoccus sp. HDW20]|nr:hypothetical protein [Tessaracoccus coleopterorum]